LRWALTYGSITFNVYLLLCCVMRLLHANSFYYKGDYYFAHSHITLDFRITILRFDGKII
jgi:hypothetical protein